MPRAKVTDEELEALLGKQVEVSCRPVRTREHVCVASIAGVLQRRDTPGREWKVSVTSRRGVAVVVFKAEDVRYLKVEPCEESGATEPFIQLRGALP